MKRKGDEHRTRYEHCLIRHDRSYLSRSCDALRHKRTFRIAEMAVEPSPQFVADTGRRLLWHWRAELLRRSMQQRLTKFMVSTDARASEQRSTGAWKVQPLLHQPWRSRQILTSMNDPGCLFGQPGRGEPRPNSIVNEVCNWMWQTRALPIPDRQHYAPHARRGHQSAEEIRGVICVSRRNPRTTSAVDSICRTISFRTTPLLRRTGSPSTVCAAHQFGHEATNAGPIPRPWDYGNGLQRRRPFNQNDLRRHRTIDLP